MTVVSPSQSNAGDTIEAADINNPINQLAAVINGGIDNTNIAPGAGIDPSKLSGGTTSMLLSWQSWTPTFTGLTLGNGTVTGYYKQIGKTVYFRLSLTFGTTTTLPTSADSYVSLPVSAQTVGMLQYASKVAVGGMFATSSIYPLDGYYYNATSVILEVMANTKYIAFNTNNYGSLSTGTLVTLQGTYEAA